MKAQRCQNKEINWFKKRNTYKIPIALQTLKIFQLKKKKKERKKEYYPVGILFE